MKNIAVVAANGKAARKIITEAVNRGDNVTAFGRHDENNTDAKTYIKKDLFALTKDDLKDFDVVVDAFGAWTPETLPLHSKTLAYLCDLLADTKVRLVIVGGAGSLYVDKDHTTTLSQTPDFPDAFLPLATAMGEALEELRKRNDVLWTYISPAANFVADGARSGDYLLGGEEFFVNEAGDSSISYADYAIAFVDEIEKGNHIQERISVIGK